VLSNFVVDHLHQWVGKRDKVIYYFCNIKNDVSSRNASAILRALIVQLCEDSRLFRKLPNRFKERNKAKEFLEASLDDLCGTFDSLVKDGVNDGLYTRIYCVIDGLDVYEKDMNHFLYQLKKSMTEARPLKFFCTSRPTSLVDVFSKPESETVWKRNLRPSTEDLERFVDQELTKLPDLEPWKMEIRKAVLQRSGNTFLWISIVLRELSGLPKRRGLRFAPPEEVRAEIYKTFDQIPEKLDQLYGDLVQRAFREDDYCIAILAWVAYAKRPLSLEALRTATAVTINHSVTSWKACYSRKATLRKSTVQETLGALVDVINDYLYLIHQSLRDFLTTTDVWDQQNVLNISPGLALGKACITFLSFEDFEVTPEDGQILGKDPFLTYASNFWYQHIDRPEDVMEDEKKLQRILQGPNTRLWDKWQGSLPEIAIYHDMSWLARLLLDKMSPILSGTFPDNCLVHAAARAPKVLRELLDHATIQRIKVTDKVVKVAAGNTGSGKEVMELLLEKRGNEVEITTEVVKAVAVNGGKEVMELLLEKRGNEVEITTEVVKAAVGNYRGKEVMELLLEKRGNEVEITTEVVKAAVGSYRGKEVMELLLEKRGNEVEITAEVVKAAAGSYRGKEIMELLLEKRGNEVEITTEVVKAAAGNYWGKEVMELLLEKRGNEVKIATEVVKVAAGNYRGKEVMELLLEKRGNEVEITTEVVKVAAGNYKVMELLLEKRGNEVEITTEVVKVAAGDYRGKEVMELLLEKRGNEVEITAEVVEAAAGNDRGKEIMELLLEKRGNEVEITTEVVKAAAGNYEVMELLLEKRGNEVEITTEVVKVAARNYKVMELLLEKRGNGVMELLLEKRLETVPH